MPNGRRRAALRAGGSAENLKTQATRVQKRLVF